jgi:SAM-dependent methyltransferase
VAPDRYDLTARAQARHFWYRGFRRHLGAVLERVSSGRRDLTILDCGCGTGANLGLLSRYGRTVGLDHSPAALRHAARLGGRVVRGDVRRLPFGDGAFDLVTSFDVLQALADDVAGLREMARVLRPGGVVIATAAALEALRGGHAAHWEEHRRYTPAMGHRLAVDAGLAPVEARFLFATLVPPIWLWRRFGPSAGAPGERLAHGDDPEIRVPVAPVNAALTGMLAFEAVVARVVPMPWGSSLLLVARKPTDP